MRRLRLNTTIGLTIQVVSTEEGLVGLRPEWDRIFLTDPHSTVFQSWEWAFWNWSFRKAGKRLYVLAVRDSEGTLRGIAPLWVREFGLRGLVKIFEFIGTRGTDYLDFTAEPGWLEPVIENCLAHLEQEARWSVVDFQEIHESSPTLPCLRAVRSFRDEQWVITPCSTCVRIPLPASWDAYRALLGASTRKDMNYDENRLRKAFSVDFRVMESQDPKFSAAVATFQRLHQARRAQLGDVGSFQSSYDTQMNAALLKACGERGWTRLFLLSLDGIVVAGFSGFEFRNQLLGETFSINPDERWRRFSVGNVLLGLIIRWGIERSLTAVDLSRGDEPYKLRFGGIPSRNYRAVAHSSSLAVLTSKAMEGVRRGLDRSPVLKRIYAACRR